MVRWVLFFLLLCSKSAIADSFFQQSTLDWVVRDLETALREPVDMNRVASLAFPIATAWKSGLRMETQDVLDRVAGFVRKVSPRGYKCGELVDIHLTIGFVNETGRSVSMDSIREALKSCEWGDSRFDLANALFFTCRYLGEDPERDFPGALKLLEASQQPDGAFVTTSGTSWFYLTSHALMAVHYCGGDPAVIERGKNYLLKQLPRFRQTGFYDGMIEILIFLRWMNADIPAYSDHLDYIATSMKSDGGICFSYKPGCRSHWHAVSLLLELQLMEKR